MKIWIQLTDSSVFLLSVLHSGDSGVSLFGEVAEVTFLFSGRHGSLQRCLMSCVAEHLARADQSQREEMGHVVLHC